VIKIQQPEPQPEVPVKNSFVAPDKRVVHIVDIEDELA